MGRSFDDDVKQQCWSKALPVPGRDPDRWRLDAAGSPVLEKRHGFYGVCGWEYDHIVPWSKDGPSSIENCQLLQTLLNRRKWNKELDLAGIKALSCNMGFTDDHLDTIEMAAYGDVNREGLKCTCVTKSQADGLSVIKGNALPCELPGLLKERKSRCEELMAIGRPSCEALTNLYLREVLNNAILRQRRPFSTLSNSIVGPKHQGDISNQEEVMTEDKLGYKELSIAGRLGCDEVSKLFRKQVISDTVPKNQVLAPLFRYRVPIILGKLGCDNVSKLFLKAINGSVPKEQWHLFNNISFPGPKH